MAMEQSSKNGKESVASVERSRMGVEVQEPSFEQAVVAAKADAQAAEVALSEAEAAGASAMEVGELKQVLQKAEGELEGLMDAKNEVMESVPEPLDKELNERLQAFEEAFSTTSLQLTPNWRNAAAILDEASSDNAWTGPSLADRLEYLKFANRFCPQGQLKALEGTAEDAALAFEIQNRFQKTLSVILKESLKPSFKEYTLQRTSEELLQTNLDAYAQQSLGPMLQPFIVGGELSKDDAKQFIQLYRQGHDETITGSERMEALGAMEAFFQKAPGLIRLSNPFTRATGSLQHVIVPGALQRQSSRMIDGLSSKGVDEASIHRLADEVRSMGGASTFYDASMMEEYRDSYPALRSTVLQRVLDLQTLRHFDELHAVSKEDPLAATLLAKTGEPLEKDTSQTVHLRRAALEVATSQALQDEGLRGLSIFYARDLLVQPHEQRKHLLTELEKYRGCARGLLKKFFEISLHSPERLSALEKTMQTVAGMVPVVQETIAANIDAMLSQPDAFRERLLLSFDRFQMSSFSLFNNFVKISLRSPEQFEEAEWTMNLFERLSSGMKASLGDSFDRIIVLPREKRLQFAELAGRIDQSPSLSLQRIKGPLLDQLMESEDPLGAYEKIEAVFTTNNLPDVGKTFKVFEILHSKDLLDQKLQNERLSPTLRAESHRGRMMTMYTDLLRIHIDSNNPSLREYVGALNEGEGIMAKVDQVGVDALDEQEGKAFQLFVSKLRRLYENSQLGKGSSETAGTEEQDVAKVYAQLKQDLGVQPNQGVNDRIVEMFAKPLGMKNLDDVLQRMDTSSRNADQRNRQEGLSGQIRLNEGDLMKGFDQKFFRRILQNGSVAKEFLGSSSDSDLTPLDTDLFKVSAEGAVQDMPTFIKEGPGKYGALLMVIRDRGQFDRTDLGKGKESQKAKRDIGQRNMELFVTGVWGENHVGVRTGLPMTEVSALVAQEQVVNDPKAFHSFCMDIVQNGYYIPIADSSGKILFTPQDFDRLKALQQPELRKPSFEVAPKHTESIRAMREAQKAERAQIQSLSLEARASIRDISKQAGIDWPDEASGIVTGPEISDTGSTARGTNVPGDIDFDFVFKLNPQDKKTSEENVRQGLRRTLGGEVIDSAPETLRLKHATIGETTGDVDVTFASKAEYTEYESHQAMADRLQQIKTKFGEEAYENVLANIAMSKQILKKAGAYKKGTYGEGGLGGLGVENWVLQHGGDMLVAFEEFLKKAKPRGQLQTFEEFKKTYQVMDTGINVKNGLHDDFVGNNLTSEGYAKMVQAVEAYVNEARA